MTLQNSDYKQILDLDLIETERVIEQNRLDAAKNAKERNRLGQFATPNVLANEVINYSNSLLSPDETICFLDPAIGTGSFYSALLQSIPFERIKRATGYEVDIAYAEAASRLWADTSLKINCADFTQSIPPQEESRKFNLLVCNPPYVRHQYLSIEKKRFLKNLGFKATGIQLSGLAGLYCYFLLAAHEWMSENGLACWLIPGEFMDVNYGKQIKEYLLSKVTLLRVHQFDSNDLQFGNTLVSTSVIWLRKTRLIADHSVEFTYGGSIRKPLFSKIISAQTLKDLSKWTKLSSLNSYQTSHESQIKFSDLFDIRRGVATGANNFFILTPQQISNLGIPYKFLTPILPSPRYLLNDEIFANEWGNPVLDRSLFLLTCTQPLEEIRIKSPSVWKYLQQGINSGVPQRYLCKHRSLWYLQETRQPTKFLCPYMGRYKSKHGKPFRFILNHSKAIAPNVYLMMYPKPPLEALLLSKPNLLKLIWSALNSIPVQKLIYEGRVYGDGLHKLEPRELANVPADVVLEALAQKSSFGFLGRVK